MPLIEALGTALWALQGFLTMAEVVCPAGMVMGCLAAGIALCFMKMHQVLKRIWLRLGLHVRPLTCAFQYPRQPCLGSMHTSPGL